MVNPYIEALKGIQLPERKPEPLEELEPARIYELADQVVEAMQRIKEKLSPDDYEDEDEAEDDEEEI